MPNTTDRHGTGDRVERQHDAHAGRDPLAAPKLQIDRKRMTEDRRQPDQHRQVDRDEPDESARPARGSRASADSP